MNKKNVTSKVEMKVSEVSKNSKIQNTLPMQKSVSERILWLAGICFVSVVFMTLKMFNMHAYAGDEAIYISQGKLIAEGFAPYKDFSMAHPPLQAVVIAVLYKIFGYNFALFRLIPSFWTLLSGFCLAVIVKKELGKMASFFAMAFFILAYEPMRAAIHFTGVNMTIAILMMALLALRNNKVLVCALLCVFAVFTRLYALPVVLSYFIFIWIKDRPAAYRFAGIGATAGLVLFVIFGLWSGFAAFMNDVFLFQANKTAMRNDQIAFMRDGVLFHNAMPLVVFILGSITFLTGYFQSLLNIDTGKPDRKAKARRPERQDISLVGLSFFTVVLMLSILLNMNRVWMYYYVLAFPFAAIAGGWMTSNWFYFIRDFFIKTAPEGKRFKINSGWAIVSMLIFIGAYFSAPKLEKRLDYYKEAISNPAKRTSRYVWREGHLPAFANALVKSMFWKDTRVIGEEYSSFTYYLWHSSRIFDMADEVSAEVLARCNEKENIFGDSGTVPLISLMTDRGIAGNVIDTNIEQFRSGNVNAAELVKKIDKPSTKLIILRDKFGIAIVPEIQNMVNRNYKEVKSFTGNSGFTLRVFERVAV